MEISFSAPISGIKTAMTRHDVTANDVANVNTPGYEERSVRQSDMPGQGVRISSIGRTPNPESTISNTDLAEEAKEQIQNKNTLTANIKVMKVKDRMLGELLDLIA
jgi:flagellar hook protein FlgE